MPIKPACASRVHLTLSAGRTVLGRRTVATARAGAICRFKAVFAVPVARLGKRRALACTVRYEATSVLAASMPPRWC